MLEYYRITVPEGTDINKPDLFDNYVFVFVTYNFS